MADQLPTTAAMPTPPAVETPVAPTSQFGASAPVGTASSTLSSSGINFIRDQRKALDQNIDKDKKIARYTMYGLTLFILILFGVMGYYYILVLDQRKIEKTTDAVTQQLSTMSTLEKEYVVYASKVKLLANLDAERTIKRNATSYFYNLVPSVNVLREVRTDDEKKKNSIIFGIDSPDVFALLALLKAFSEKDVYDKGYIITVSGLTRASDGTYGVEGSMDYARATDLNRLGAAK